MRAPKQVALLAVGVLTAAVGAVGAAPGWAAASSRVRVVTPTPTISALTSAPSVLYNTGGAIYLSAQVTNATICTFTSNKALTGLPVTVACSGGTAVADVTVPANAGKKALTYKVTLTASSVKKAKASLGVAVGVSPPPARCSVVGPGADLANCNMSNLNLSGFDLTGADLVGANLAGANFSHSSLFAANLSYASAIGANFSNADLSDTNLSGAVVDGASLTGSDVQNMVLDYTSTSGTSSGGLTGTLGPSSESTAVVADGYLFAPDVSLAGANLNGDNLTGLDLEGADLTGANLTNAIVTGADLGGANLMAAVLAGISSGSATGVPFALPSSWSFINGYLVGPGADLTNAQFQSANLSGSSLIGANLTGAQLRSSDLAGADLTGANLTNAVLSGTALIQTDLNGTILTGAGLDNVSSGWIGGTPAALPTHWTLDDSYQSGFYLVGPGANLSGANFEGTNLSDLNLSGVNLSGANLSSSPYLPIPQTNLSGANLSGANLSSADFYDSNLSGADLTDTILTYTSFYAADLSGANLAGAQWSLTTCPDGTFSQSDVDMTCANDLTPGPP